MLAKQRDDQEAHRAIWNPYIDQLKDQLKEIGVDLYRAAVHVLAGLTGTARVRAEGWVSAKRN